MFNFDQQSKSFLTIRLALFLYFTVVDQKRFFKVIFLIKCISNDLKQNQVD